MWRVETLYISLLNIESIDFSISFSSIVFSPDVLGIDYKHLNTELKIFTS